MSTGADARSTPLVTVAMPIHNAAATLGPAIRSLLAQSYTNWRLEIVDDGSTDRSAEVVTAFADERIHYVAEGRRLGLATRLNQIIDYAQGEYLARLDADDIAYPHRLERQVAFLESHPEVDLVGGAALLFRDDGSVDAVWDVVTEHEALAAQRWHGFRIPHPSWLGRLGWFSKYRYDPGMPRAQDQELLLRASPDSRYACLAEILIGYRKTDSFLGKRLSGRFQLTRALLRAALSERCYGRLPQVVAEQLLKAGFDCLMAAPLVGGLLSHPAGRAVRPDEFAEWSRVSQAVRLTEGTH